MSADAYAMPWTSSPKVLNTVDHEDSAFHEYSNPVSSNSFDSEVSASSPSCPDYEEVRGLEKQMAAAKLDNAAAADVAYVYNLASAASEKRSSSERRMLQSPAGSAVASPDKERIMTSKVFCIHKVSELS